MNLQEIIRQTRAHFCLDCGKCTAVCPVNRFDPQFSPRLIVQKALSNGGGGYDDARIWSCVGCNMCTVRCNYNVSYVELIRHLRAQSRENGTELVYSHGGVTESVMHMMGRDDIRQDRSGWLPADIQVNPQGDTAFFVGCAPYFDTIFKDLNVKLTDGTIGAMRLLNAAGAAFSLLDNERCCGHDLLLAGDNEGFAMLGRNNVEELRARGIKKIITSCPECYYTLKVDYPRYVDGWNLEVTHITELPAIQHLKGAHAKKTRAAFHDSCKLGRHFKMYDGPRNLLTAMSGAEICEMENNRENSLCCGASPWMFCGSVNKQIQDERLRQANATGADYMVTSCPKCQIHLTCAGMSGNGKYAGVKIVDLYHLAAQSLAHKENG
jgi:heterodisulfide reductase subunit D